MSAEAFSKDVKKAAERFLALPGGEPVKIISHLDTDGICSCSILVRALSLCNKRYFIQIVPQLDARILGELADEGGNIFIFSDLGSGQIDFIDRFLPQKNIFILDHHAPGSVREYGNISHVNPHLHGIDGSREISGSGVVYHFARELDARNEDLAYVAVIGAIGDNQEHMGFKGMNADILKAAQASGKLVVKKGLRLFGAQTKPLHKLLEYSYTPYLPGVTGSESGAIQFLRSIGINPAIGSSWKKLSDLTDAEMSRLTESIILKSIGEKNPGDIVGPIYHIAGEPDGPFKDVREISTMLNACGRMGKASFGIGVCLGEPKMKSKALAVLKDYRRELVSALRWFEDNLDTQAIQKEDGFIIINAGYSIMPSIAGTVASIIANSKLVEKGTCILSMARTQDKKTKISLRFAARKSPIDLREIATKIVSRLPSGEAGGHWNAAGAIIPVSEEKEFLRHAREILREQVEALN